MTVYEKGRKGDETKFCDFANMVFSMEKGAHDFRTLLPKMYAEGVENASRHHVAYDEKGAVLAMVAMHPLTVMLGENSLNVGYIGTVSVHPHARGEGHMKRLMARTHEEAREKGLDLLALGGQRQRYNYFGYERAGMHLEFELTKTNVAHALKQANVADISFRKIEKDDHGLIEACYALYEQRPVHGARKKEDFWLIMQSWAGSIYAVYHKGIFSGMVQISQRRNPLGDVLLREEGLLPLVLKALMQWFALPSLTLVVFPHETKRIALMEEVAETVKITHDHMVKILHYPKVLQTLLRFKGTYTALTEGEFVFQIDDQILKLSVSDGEITCKESKETPSVILDELSALRLFFSLSNAVCQGKAQGNWFPLPWGLPKPDHF